MPSHKKFIKGGSIALFASHNDFSFANKFKFGMVFNTSTKIRISKILVCTSSDNLLVMHQRQSVYSHVSRAVKEFKYASASKSSIHLGVSGSNHSVYFVYHL